MKNLVYIVFFGLLGVCYTMQSQTLKGVYADHAKSLIETSDPNKTVLIDARTKSMFEEEHIMHAINIDAFSDKAAEQLAKLMGYDTIMVYCTVNNRTSRICEALQEIGYSGTILAITDGIKAWKQMGFNTVSANQPQQNFHLAQKEPKADDSPKGKPIVQVFGNFDYNATKDAIKTYGFWFGRAHFGYEYQFSQQFTGKIIIDAGRPTTVGQIQVTDPIGNELDVTNTSKEGSYYTMTLKFASLEWTPSEMVRIQAGGVLQNHYITQEKFWGYRYLAPTFQDRYYGIPSGDLGLISYFTINKMFGFDVALTNGEGFRFDQDVYSDVKIAGGLDFNPIKGLQTRLFYDFTSSKNPAKPANQQLFSTFVGYRQKELFRFGGEYNYHKNHLNIDNHNLFGFSLYGSYTIFEQVELFARFDQLESNTMSGEHNGWYFSSTGDAYIMGIHYNPVKGVNLSLNYQGWNPESNDIDFQHHILLSFEYKL